MTLQRNKQEWEDLADVDPLWAVLTDPAHQFGGWEVEEFFQTGEVEIKRLMDSARAIGYPQRWEKALDFGCGVGRLTRALSRRFDQCYGVDISERMVQQARELNADRKNCSFVVNVSPDLRQFETHTFDFVYSARVLQHLPSSDHVRRYVGEFVRVVRPGGLVVFQLPSFIPWRNRVQPRRRLYSLLRAAGLPERVLYERARLHPLRMNAVPEHEVRRFVEAQGGVIAHAETDDEAAKPYPSFRYYVHLPPA